MPARLYVRHVNERYARTGTLWEGRHKASLIVADEYLLSCYRYIKLNPVREGMVMSPDVTERQHHYRQLFSGHMDAEYLVAGLKSQQSAWK